MLKEYSSRVLLGMAQALPNHPHISDLSTSYEVVALLAHSVMVSLNFRLCGFDQNKLITQQCEKSHPRLPSSWNDGYGQYTLVYSHANSPALLITRVNRLGTKFEVISFVACDGGKILRFEKVAQDYINPVSLPIRISTNSDGSEDRSDLVEKMRAVFVTEAALEDLLEQYTQTISFLMPDVRPSEAQPLEAPDVVATLPRLDWAPDYGRNPETLIPLPRPDITSPIPGRQGPAAEFSPPRFEDEYEMNLPPRFVRGPLLPDGSSPSFNIGYDDLNPPGMGPPGLEPMRPGGMGMHPTFEDPLFAHGGIGMPARPGLPGQGSDNPYGGDQVPPGARYDPIGPGGPHFPGRAGPSRGNPFGGGFGGGII